MSAERARRCTCEPPTWSEPFVGMCEFCEQEEHDAEWGLRDDDLQAMADAQPVLAALSDQDHGG